MFLIVVTELFCSNVSMQSNLSKLFGVLAMAITLLNTSAALADEPRGNIAVVARVSTSYVSGHESLAAINDAFDPADSRDHKHGCYGNWPEHGTQWVQYEWDQPISTNGSAVYWWDDHQGVHLPKAARLLYWDGKDFVPVISKAATPVTVSVAASSPLGVEPDHYNAPGFRRGDYYKNQTGDGCHRSIFHRCD